MFCLPLKSTQTKGRVPGCLSASFVSGSFNSSAIKRPETQAQFERLTVTTLLAYDYEDFITNDVTFFKVKSLYGRKEQGQERRNDAMAGLIFQC